MQKIDMEQFDGRQSLALIESMINKAKNNFSESGTLYLVWGIVVFICALSQYILIDFFNYEDSYAVWFLTWLVVIYQVIFLARKKKKNVVVTYTDEILKYVWLCFTFCLILVI